MHLCFPLPDVFLLCQSPVCPLSCPPWMVVCFLISRFLEISIFFLFFASDQPLLVFLSFWKLSVKAVLWADVLSQVVHLCPHPAWHTRILTLRLASASVKVHDSTSRLNKDGLFVSVTRKKPLLSIKQHSLALYCMTCLIFFSTKRQHASCHSWTLNSKEEEEEEGRLTIVLRHHRPSHLCQWTKWQLTVSRSLGSR